MLKTILMVLAIVFVVFIFFIVCFKFASIKSFFKNIKKKSGNIKKSDDIKKTDGEKKEKPEKSAEKTFIPKNKSDSDLKPVDSVYDFEDETQIKSEPENETQKDDFDVDKKLLKTKRKNNNSLSSTIKKLPPKIKAMLIDNTLKRRDDV